MDDKCRRQTVVVDGERLEIVAERVDDTGWELAVVNSLGVYSIWTESFGSAEVALETALHAIETEGVAPFVDIEGFEYLLDR